VWGGKKRGLTIKTYAVSNTSNIKQPPRPGTVSYGETFSSAKERLSLNTNREEGILQKFTVGKKKKTGRLVGRFCFWRELLGGWLGKWLLSNRGGDGGAGGGGGGFFNWKK